MKRFLPLILIAVFVLPLHALDKSKHKMVQRYNTITKRWASYPGISIHDIQYVPPESLAVADAHQVLGDVSSPYWTSQVSSYMGDTVVLTAVVVTPAAPYDPWFGMTFTQHGWTMLLHDTAANSNEWGGILVRVGNGFVNPGGPDTAQARTDKFLNMERGDIVQITGWVEEFPTQRINSTTQFRPYPGIQILNVGSAAIPPPTQLPVSDFYVGGYPGGTVKFSTGEKYEGSLVELHNLTVNVLVNQGRGTWAMTDPGGNYIAEYDASHFYTFGNENPLIPGDPSFALPPIGGVVDTIRGTMLTVSGGENARGYRICPLYSDAALAGYTGDVIYGISLPSVNTHRRYPVVVRSDDSVDIRARVAKVAGGYDIGSAHLFVSINNAPWEDHPMSIYSLVDSIYHAYIFDIDGNPWPANTFVKYFIKGIDDHGNSQILANPSFNFANDSSKGFFFYTVLGENQPMSIRDIQYTPYVNGRSPYVGSDTDLVTVKGIVTADSSDIVLTPTGTFGTTAWYIQDGPSPWSGIWVVSRGAGSYAALSALHRGDSVSITGNVQENFDVTRIQDSTVVFHASGRPVPSPVTLTSAFFNSGNQNVEPYEGMLVKIVGSTLTSVDPVFQEPWEFAVDNSAGSATIVRRDGFHSYSNVESDTVTGKKILHVSDRVDTVIGICYNSHSNWKVIPRLNPDIVAGEPYEYFNGWNMISITRNQLPSSTGYDKTTLFPNVVPNAFSYNGSYVVEPILPHKKGLWLKFNGAQIVRQLGAKRTNDTIPVVAGWNLVATIANPVRTNTFIASPPGNHLSTFYGYSGTYFIEDTLKPPQGYWVKADSDGYFVENAPAIVPKIAPRTVSIAEFNTLTISDKEGHSQKLYFGQDTERKLLMRDYEMPPGGPEGSSFDVRYASGRILEAYPAVVKDGQSFGITVNAQSSPITVRWNIVNPEGKHFRLADAVDGKILKSREMVGANEITINASGSIHLNLSVEGGAIPKEFSLSQNYPNPFNPSTKLVVALPQAAHVEAVVYNLLGQRVASLIDENRDAGFHTITWNGTAENGTAASSGVYFVRVSADKFNAVRKILMMK